MLDHDSDFMDVCGITMRGFSTKLLASVGADLSNENGAVHERVTRIIGYCLRVYRSVFARMPTEYATMGEPEGMPVLEADICMGCNNIPASAWVVIHEHCTARVCTACYDFIFADAEQRGIPPECPVCRGHIERNIGFEDDNEQPENKFTTAYKHLSEFAERERIVKMRVDKQTSVFKQRRQTQPQVLQDYKRIPNMSAELLLGAATETSWFLKGMVDKPPAKKQLRK